ncbi:MAG TPA: NAD-dependent epimerase/dehydratase family protein, partial [Thermoanaerobaculia bacterium]|nr:NAD-dependent epimerase/dehydratase family protein [Thermoanaerobaculia bacterium]
MATVKRRRRAGGRVVDFTAAPRRPKVVVTGASGVLGSRLVRALASRGDREVVVFDLAPAADTPQDVAHRFVDLNLPYADGTLLKLLKEVRPDAVVHLASLRSPSRDTTYAHELNSIGTLHVLAAAGEAGIARVVLGSTTLVYGARGDNPNFLTEDHPPRPDAADAFVRDFVEAEQHARSHAKRYPSCRLAILRFAPLLAPEIRDYRTKYLEAPAAVTLMGYDPLLQFLDPDDAIDALVRVLDRPDVRGVLNVAPDGVVPLSSVLMLYGTLAVPVPHGLAYPLVEAGWLSGVALMPGVHAHYFRYLCVADNEKARQVLGFTPRRTTLDNVVRT